MYDFAVLLLSNAESCSQCTVFQHDEVYCTLQIVGVRATFKLIRICEYQNVRSKEGDLQVVISSKTLPTVIGGEGLTERAACRY